MYLPNPVGLWSYFPVASSEGSGDGVLGGGGGVLVGAGLGAGNGRDRIGC